MYRNFLLFGIAICLQPVRSQGADTVIDFENLALGTIVTTQFAGVTFSALPDSCGAGNLIDCLIVDPSGTTSSGTKGLSLETGCPDFSPDYLRMVFDEGHRRVSFTLGDFAGTYQVRVYSTTSGNTGLLLSTSIIIEGTGSVGVHRLVTLTRTAAEIRRVEIEEAIGQFEVIDDLSFDCPDITAPLAALTIPAPLACMCYGGDIEGSAYDADDTLQSWRLERKAPAAAAWTLISGSSAEIMDGFLSSWFPAASASQGYYVHRLQVVNRCGLEADATNVVWLDRNLDSLELRGPGAGAIVGGTVCADGTAWDQCQGTFSLARRAEGEMSYVPFDVVFPPWVIDDPLGTWNTAGESEGDYDIRLSATDGCSNTANVVRQVTVDNTPPIAKLSLPKPCDCVNGVVAVRGTADDNHLRGWVLQYSDPEDGTWVTITSGHNMVSGGIFGNWDTTHLPDCAYVLRLVVTDNSVIDCDDYQQSEYLLPVEVGPCYDFDTDDDNDIDLLDYSVFEDEFSGP